MVSQESPVQRCKRHQYVTKLQKINPNRLRAESTGYEKLIFIPFFIPPSTLACYED